MMRTLGWMVAVLCGTSALWAESRLEGSLLVQEVKDRVVDSWKTAGYDATVVSTRMPRSFEGPCGSLRWEIPMGAADQRVGNTRVPVRIFRKGRLVEETEVAIRVTLRAKVAVAAVPLRRLGTVEEGQIRWVEQVFDVHPEELILSAAKLKGKRLRREVSSGTRLASNLLEENPLVKRGDMVDVTASQGSVRLTLRGVAESDGHLKEVVRVKSLDTGRILLAQVSESGALEMK